MVDKTREQLEDAIDVDRKLKEEREISDKSYAVKVVEYIVFAIVGTIAMAFLYKLISIVLQQYVKT
jgi:hypothetical protein